MLLRGEIVGCLRRRLHRAGTPHGVYIPDKKGKVLGIPVGEKMICFGPCASHSLTIYRIKG